MNNFGEVGANSIFVFGQFGAHVYFQPTIHCIQNLVDFLPLSMTFWAFGAKRHGTEKVEFTEVDNSPLKILCDCTCEGCKITVHTIQNNARFN